MSLILCIETATKVCSVSLLENNKVLGSQELFVDRSHSEFLAVLIKDLLRYTGKGEKELSAVAVSKGPGSYTGLRIGVSTAKGLCYGLDIPLIAINSLLAMAYEISSQNISKFDLCPMLDARRMEVYCMVTDYDLKIKQKTEAKIIDQTSFIEELKDNSILFFGDGMSKCRDTLCQHKNAYFIDDIHPRAANIGHLAYQKYKKQKFENTETFEPFYLKDFITTTPKKFI